MPTLYCTQRAVYDGPFAHPRRVHDRTYCYETMKIYSESVYKQRLTLKNIAQEQRDKIESDMRPHEHIWVFVCARIERR